MSEIQSQSHRAEVREGVLRVYAWRVPLLRTVTCDAEGVHETLGPLPSALDRLGSDPTFAATYAGDRYCEVDISCGFRRWHGNKSLMAVRKALGKCGFNKQESDNLLKQMKAAGDNLWCPHYY